MTAGVKRRYAMVRASMMGSVSYIQRSTGSTVEAGDTIMAVEAMKLISSITAPLSGEVEVLVSVGEMVAADQVVAKIYV